MIASAVDNALPPPVTAALRRQIVAAHRRDRGGGTHWYALAAPPRLLFEQVIQHLRRFVARPDTIVGAEWWFRAAHTDAGFPFHFDRDEGIRTTIVSPDIASILYLGNTGGPTVILDAKPARATAPKAGVAVHPRTGRLAMFPGALLHGVIPGAPSRWPRVTLLVNWWRTFPRLERATTQPLSPRLAGRWRAAPTHPTLPAIDPARLLAPAAWREVIAQQTAYR